MTEKFNKKIAYDILRIRLGQIVINEEYKKGKEISVTLNTKLTPELEAEGFAREI